MAADFAIPPRCAGCGCVIGNDHQLCAPCWASVEFITGTGCTRCGIPVPPAIEICAPCLATPPEHDGACAAVIYGDVSRQIILRLKHGRRIGLARFIARHMHRILPEGDWLLVPVPLHRWRLWRRGFNQSALVASRLARLGGNQLALDALWRTRSTPMLGGFGATARANLLRGAFAADPDRVRGCRILLIDDVYTSGATANACARALKRAGASEVQVLSWARVVRADSLH